MTGVFTFELDHCRELVMLPGSLFEFTSRFLPSDQRESLLTLYALVRAVSIIPDTTVDEEVKWAKLKWWNEELAADPVSSSRHPILRALWLSGARTYLNNELLQQLIRDAVMQIDAAPDSDEKALLDRFAALGATEIRLELALEKAEIGIQNLKFLGAATRLYRLISSIGAGQWSESGRIPLNILAKYNVSAAQLEQGLRTAEFAQVIAQLAEEGQEWFSKGMSGLKVSSNNGVKSGVCTHLQLRWSMERRRLATISKNASGFLDAGKHYGPADAWFAWRVLRRLR